MSRWEELEKAAKKAQSNGQDFGVVVMPDDILELLAERDRIKADYDRACKLVAEMHMASMGGVIGPALGVVEDVAAIKEARDTLKAELQDLATSYEIATANAAVEIAGLRAEIERINTTVRLTMEMR